MGTRTFLMIRPFGPPRLFDDLADRIRELRYTGKRVRHRGDPLPVEREPVDERLRQALLFRLPPRPF